MFCSGLLSLDDLLRLWFHSTVLWLTPLSRLLAARLLPEAGLRLRHGVIFLSSSFCAFAWESLCKIALLKSLSVTLICSFSESITQSAQWLKENVLSGFSLGFECLVAQWGALNEVQDCREVWLEGKDTEFEFSQHSAGGVLLPLQ